MSHQGISNVFQRFTAAIGCVTITLMASGCSVFGINSVEEAPYTVLINEENYELREYAPIVVAQTTVDAEFKQAGKLAFNRLFDYISGNNQRETKIAMTAPVIADPQNTTEGSNIAMTAPVLGEMKGGAWQYSFVLPATYTIETAPRPLDPQVSLASLPSKKVAVMRYSGRQSAEKMRDKSKLLQEWVVANDLSPVSNIRWAGYNPPWTLPFLRRNEVLIDVIQ